MKHVNMSILGRGHSTTCGCDGCFGARIARGKATAEDKKDVRYNKAHG